MSKSRLCVAWLLYREAREGNRRHIKNLITETRELTRWSGRLSGFVEDQTSILSIRLSWLRAPVPEDPTHSS